jgi:hypothetical protein
MYAAILVCHVDHLTCVSVVVQKLPVFVGTEMAVQADAYAHKAAKAEFGIVPQVLLYTAALLPTVSATQILEQVVVLFVTTAQVDLSPAATVEM